MSDTPPPTRFLILGSLEIHRANQGVSCRVELLQAGDTFPALVEDLDTEPGRLRAAVGATLAAARAAAPELRVGLEGAQLLDLFGRRYVALSLETAAGRRAARVPALVALDDSVEHAACLATLDALNRCFRLRAP